MRTFSGPNGMARLASHHAWQFRRRLSEARKHVAGPVRRDLLWVCFQLFNETGISGLARRRALRQADYPFAQRHGSAQWPTPPIGVISGRLRNAIRVEVAKGGYEIALGAVIRNVPYSRFILSPTGTKFMVPRGVKEAACEYAAARSGRLVQELRTIMTKTY